MLFAGPLMHHPLELLSPARDLAALKAALSCGADAVYMGGPDFSARHEAGNTLDDLKEAAGYCHRCGARLHVAVNTLLDDDEQGRAKALLQDLAAIGADVIIVQDLSLLEYMPQTLEVHASTQCNIDTKEKLKFYHDLGCKQAVLPRELSLDEIREFHDYCPDIRLEVFVSGALCVGQSGICHISELMTGRSANRGRCAQICRLPMQLYKDDKLISEGHLLNLKDNDRAAFLPELVDCGVSSFKIEGRLKDLVYVKNQTAYFSEKLNKICQKRGLERSSLGSCSYAFTPDLNKTFNRGFTNAFLQGSNDDVLNRQTPKFTGPRIGTVAGSLKTALKVKTKESLHNGDGLTFFDEKGSLTGFRINSVQVEGPHSAVKLLKPLNLKPGTVLYRNADAEFEKLVQREDSARRMVPLTQTLAYEDKILTLTCRDAFGRTGCAQMPYDPQGHEDGGALDDAQIQATLQKCSLSFARVQNLTCENLPALHLKLSALNSLRKEAQRSYEEACLNPKSKTRFKLPDPLPKPPFARVDPRLVESRALREFYQKLGVSIAEDKGLESKTVLTSRHCLVKSEALCFKEGGSIRGFKLKIGKHVFDIVCDCKHCRMRLLKRQPGAAHG